MYPLELVCFQKQHNDSLMQPQDLHFILDSMLTDTCNRYLNLVDELGVIDQKKRQQKQAAILATGNALLDEWVPFYAKQLAAFIQNPNTKSKSE
jgi:hypothetical protein